MKRFVLGSLEPCYERNPVLWRIFCALTDRRFDQPNYNWSEQDTINWILSRGINRDAGTHEINNGPEANHQQRFDANSELLDEVRL